MPIQHWDVRRDGPFPEANWRREPQACGYRAARHVYTSDTCFPPHAHDRDRIVAVLSGRYRVTPPGKNIVLRVGDVTAIPRDAVHDRRCRGGEPVVSLDVIRIG